MSRIWRYTARMGVLDALRASLRVRPAAKRAEFRLLYEPSPSVRIDVGHLTFDGRSWVFTYDDEYKRRGDLRPLEGFPDKTQTYRSTVLFPIFAVRIPDLDRRDVRRRLKQDRLQDPDLIDMLRLFGRRVVSSPGFELIPCTAA